MFVGREAELAQIVGAFERCVEDRAPILVTVTGSPGIGKTRLRREALSHVASDASAPRVVLARCEPFAKGHALGAVADIARGLTGVPRGADLRAAIEATDALVRATAVPSTEASRELLARLVSNEALRMRPSRSIG